MDLNDHTDGKIIALGTAPRSPADRALADLRSYWEALRQGRPVPARAEVDPRGIERALDYTFLLERIAPGMGRFRLAGMHLNDLMGMEVRGMPLSTFFAPLSRKPAAELLEGRLQIGEIAAGMRVATANADSNASLLACYRFDDSGATIEDFTRP
ncbi:PAS domain-containing protein, partial [Candidatus Falkowbacteria bacterium]|nr:PAS domain-containing protein [Candidatus Falkowbacteria bacterium]